MHAPSRASIAPLALAASLASACLYSGGGGGSPSRPPAYDPRGAEASLSFSWRIDGQDPRAVPTACQAAGVRYVQMSVVDDQDQAHVYDSLRWDCNLGSYRSARPEVRAGTYRVFWEAVNTEGRRVSLAPARRDEATGAVVPAPEPVTFVAGQTVDFDRGNQVDPALPGAPTNFATGAGPLRVTLRYATAAGAAGDCAAAGVTEITWQLKAPNGVAVEDHTRRETCSRYPTVTWERVIWDDYALTVTGTDASGAVVARGTCPHLLATRDPQRAMYECTVTRAN